MRKAKLENERALQKEPGRETQGRAQTCLKIFGFAFVFAVVDSCEDISSNTTTLLNPEKG